MVICGKLQQTLKVYHSLEEFNTLERAVATTGTFDGVHLGHQKILKQLTSKAAAVGGESVLLTFHPHPRTVLHPDLDLKMLNTLDEKILRLEKSGLDHLIIHPFTKEFSRTTSLEFVREILVNTIGVRHLVIGYDHHFGRNREGSFAHLKEFGPIYGFEVEEITALDVDEVNVSSTKIRKALEQGDVQTAQEYLGASYSVTGEVVLGNQLGRTLGFPTANLQLSTPIKLLPADGVYAGWAAIELTDRGTSNGIADSGIQADAISDTRGLKWRAMANVGHRPTVKSSEKTIEIHLLDFDGDLYGQKITFQFTNYLREIQEFSGLEELKSQLGLDKEKTNELLA